MTPAHDKIWARQTTGWGDIEGGQWRNVPMMTDEPEIFAPVYLIATPAREAADDMLTALEAALSYIEGEESVMGSPCATGNIVRAAIARAKGGAA